MCGDPSSLRMTGTLVSLFVFCIRTLGTVQQVQDNDESNRTQAEQGKDKVNYKIAPNLRQSGSIACVHTAQEYNTLCNQKKSTVFVHTIDLVPTLYLQLCQYIQYLPLIFIKLYIFIQLNWSCNLLSNLKRINAISTRRFAVRCCRFKSFRLAISAVETALNVRLLLCATFHLDR